jgi:hypothetical protein
MMNYRADGTILAPVMLNDAAVNCDALNDWCADISLNEAAHFIGQR